MRNPYISLVEIAGKGGICHYTYNLAQALSKSKEVEIGTANVYELEEMPRDFEIIRVFNRLRTNPFKLLGYIYDLRRGRPQVVHFQLSQYPVFVLVLVWLVRIVTNCRIVVTSHNVISHEQKDWEKAIYQYIYNRVDKVIVHAEHSKKLMLDCFKMPSEKIAVIQHGNYMFFNDVLGSEPISIGSGKVVLFFGYIRKYKGLQYLIQAFAKVKEALPEAKLLIVGKPVEPFDIYQKEIESLNLQDNIETNLKYVPFEKVKEYFRKATVVVLPYLDISQSGIVQLTYGFGKPIIATAVGGLPEAVEDGKSGFVVPPQDIDTLAARIITLLKDYSLQKSMGEYSLYLAKTKFSWDSIAKETLELYEGLL
jgi:glycosyltransferase involved in cell wall biosynthesis